MLEIIKRKTKTEPAVNPAKGEGKMTTYTIHDYKGEKGIDRTVTVNGFADQAIMELMHDRMITTLPTYVADYGITIL